MSERRTAQRCLSPGPGWVCTLALVTGMVWACAPPAPAPGTVAVLFFGNSLTAGLGVRADQAFPARVAAQLNEQGWDITLLDAGRNGDTTAGGRARLRTWLDRRPDVAVVELGGNDGLQRLSLEAMEANLSAIVEALQARGIRVVLLGVELPFFLGDASGFRAVFRRVANEYDVPLLDNLLEDVTGNPGRMQADGIHPTPDGHAIMAERVTDFLQSSGVLD